jgi:hypothetical protein
MPRFPLPVRARVLTALYSLATLAALALSAGAGKRWYSEELPAAPQGEPA